MGVSPVEMPELPGGAQRPVGISENSIGPATETVGQAQKEKGDQRRMLPHIGRSD